MNKTWEDIKAIWHRISFPMLFLVSIGSFIAYLYEPFPVAMNAYLTTGDPIPLILLFDVIGILLCFVIAGILLLINGGKWAWVPFTVGTLFVLPKLFVLHFMPVDYQGFQLFIAYAILLGTLPGIYFGWLISRAAIENREKGNRPDK